jgi:hypothetical protein
VRDEAITEAFGIVLRLAPLDMSTSGEAVGRETASHNDCQGNPRGSETMCSQEMTTVIVMDNAQDT